MSTYIDHLAFHYSLPGENRGRWFPAHSWADHTRLNLLQHYPPDQVARIMAGNDHRTQADIARWNALGRRSAA